MTAPAPLFITRFSQPIGPRLAVAEIACQARVVAPQLADPADPRLEDSASEIGLRAVTQGAEPRLLVEWPDMVLAWAFIPFGLQATVALETALRDAYQRGRDVLERLHIELGQQAGNA